jgi:hypothetical protein
MPYSVDEIISFSGTASDPEEGVLPAAQLEWEVLLHHNQHVHGDFLRVTGSAGSFVAPDHGDNTSITICLTARDSQGLSATSCRNIAPRTVVYRFETIPSGLEIVYEGLERTTPFSVETIVGARQLISTQPIQARRSFSTWSQGGAWEQVLTIGGDALTLTATFANQPPTATLSPTASASYTVGETLRFSVTASDPEEKELSGEQLSWQLVHIQGGVRTTLLSQSGSEVQFVVPPAAGQGSIEILLTASDSQGATASLTRTLLAQQPEPEPEPEPRRQVYLPLVAQ